MAFNTTLSLEAQNYNMQGLSAANMAVNYSFLTNALVASADTNAGIVSAIQGAAQTANVSYELKQTVDRICRAITRNIGVFTDAAINPLTTTAGFIALATAADPRLPSDYTATSPSE